ncbi:probable carboxylesterase 2 [Phalaenopsis equestris]|uniref:probable carboxylesterase 2 n=1 Tax=Phalaenopsis equestris TaxID=78828 RepID=UPI0009E61321|nr:probable carboxylesterase 2 [Phalaenopsis equestris]
MKSQIHNSLMASVQPRTLLETINHLNRRPAYAAHFQTKTTHLFDLPTSLPPKSTMSPNTTSDDDELIYDMISMMRAYRSGRVDRFEPFEFLPPSIDPITGVHSKDITLNPTNGLSVRFYRPPSIPSNGDQNHPILVFYHGGGFCLHRPSSAHYHNYLNHLTSKANIVAVSVDYRLAPEHPLPAAYEDSWEALQWVIASRGSSDGVILAGDSAGGNIVHNLGMRMGSEGRKVEGIVLLNPYFWGEEKIGVELEGKEGSFLKVKDLDPAWEFVCPGTKGPNDPRINPVAEGAPGLELLGCRRVLVSCGEMDLLVDRARIYGQKLKESGWGGEVEFVMAEGEDHGFFFLYPQNERAVVFMDRFVAFCNNVKVFVCF